MTRQLTAAVSYQLAQDRAVGFFAYPDWISRAPESPMLRLLVVVQRQESTRVVWVPTHLPLDYRSLRPAWEYLVGRRSRGAGPNRMGG